MSMGWDGVCRVDVSWEMMRGRRRRRWRMGRRREEGWLVVEQGSRSERM